jgi:anaerobic magnesium-protoporphyrin IX monomethyl ester cyclase
VKVLLLNPPVDYRKQFGDLDDFYTPIPSIGLASIGALLLKNGFEVEGLDAFLGRYSVDEMLDRIIVSAPDVLGISLLTAAAPLVESMIPRLREKLPQLTIVMGNIHATTFDKDYLLNNTADYIVYQEGEFTMLELMRELASKGNPEAVEGISFLDSKGQYHKNPSRKYITGLELDELPYPAWELFPVDQFKPDIRLDHGSGKHKDTDVQVLPILATRGCPHSCTFCTPINTIGKQYRMRSENCVVDEMEYFHNKWGVDTFYYMDLTFPISEKIGLKFCDALIKRKLKVKWFCETRVSSVTKQLLKKMKEAGCVRIDYGIEAGNQKMLDSVKKGFTIEQVRKAIDATNEAGIEAEGLFILGLPDETVQDTWDTIHFALSLNIDHLKFNLFVPYPGSDTWDTLLEKGELDNFNFSRYTSFPSYTEGGKPIFIPKGRTYEELLAVQQKAMRMAFFRKKVILRELKHFKFDKISQYFSAVKALLLPPPTVDTTSDRFTA